MCGRQLVELADRRVETKPKFPSLELCRRRERVAALDSPFAPDWVYNAVCFRGSQPEVQASCGVIWIVRCAYLRPRLSLPDCLTRPKTYRLKLRNQFHVRDTQSAINKPEF